MGTVHKGSSPGTVKTLALNAQGCWFLAHVLGAGGGCWDLRHSRCSLGVTALLLPALTQLELVGSHHPV